MNDKLSARSRADYSRARFQPRSIGSDRSSATSIIWLKVADNHFNRPTKQRSVLSKE